MDDLLQQLFNGLSQGSIYALIAVGYTMIYGIIQLINFAHGDVMMVGAYVALGGTLMGLGFIPSLVIAMLTCAILGVVIERVAYRKVRPVSRLGCSDQRYRYVSFSGIHYDVFSGSRHPHISSWVLYRA